jgi:hypothetical protein
MDKHEVMARGRMGQRKRSCAKDQSARVGHRERSAWPRGARIDSKES